MEYQVYLSIAYMHVGSCQWIDHGFDLERQNVIRCKPLVNICENAPQRQSLEGLRVGIMVPAFRV